MPFTIAHPAIILPLCRNKKLSVTALFVGSMVPDFEFFFQLREVENIGHHWYGILLFDMPIALLLAYLFHGLLRNVLIQHLPSFLKSRVINCKSFDWNAHVRRYPFSVAFSLVVGIFSHIVWDGFTHDDGFFVSKMPFLLNKTGWAFLNIPFYFLLQLLFSVIGLIAVLYVIYQLPQQALTSSISYKSYFWESFALLMVSFLFVRIIGWPQYNSFGGLMIAFMGCCFYAWVLASLLFHNIFKNHKHEY
jgi:hypothetical protein